MPFTLTMPKLSPTMEEGTIVKWHKKVGDLIKAGDLLLEVATDKATVEFNAIDGGWLRKVIIDEGHEAVVNQPIGILTEKKNESIDGYKPEGEAPKIVEQVVSNNAPVKEVTKVSTAPTGGAMRQPAFVPEAPLETFSFDRPESSGGRVKASPLARKIAKEKGLDLSTVKGTGPGDRIVSADLARAQPTGLVAFNRTAHPEKAAGSYVEESLTPMRKVIGQRLQEAKTFIPHFYVSMKVDAQPMNNLREQLKSNGVKITVNDIIIRATALALRAHPKVNSGFNSVSNNIIRFQTIDISVAVSIDGGLITPIIRNADYKNLGEISLEVKQLAGRAKEGKLDPHEYKGGSFTISNLGMYGVSEFIAIINPPQAAILAVSGIADVPVVRNGLIVPGSEITFTLSGDHRVIDGVAGAEFLRTLKGLLEAPAVLLV